jgi:hypothetical protein
MHGNERAEFLSLPSVRARSTAVRAEGERNRPDTRRFHELEGGRFLASDCIQLKPKVEIATRANFFLSKHDFCFSLYTVAGLPEVYFLTKNCNLGNFWRAFEWKILVYYMII